MDYTSGSRPSAELSTAAMAYLTDLPKELHSALRAGICTPFRPFRGSPRDGRLYEYSLTKMLTIVKGKQHRKSETEATVWRSFLDFLLSGSI